MRVSLLSRVRPFGHAPLLPPRLRLARVRGATGDWIHRIEHCEALELRFHVGALVTPGGGVCAEKSRSPFFVFFVVSAVPGVFYSLSSR
uniref:Uncharacterized protein n=1 Tax=Knipowitschia caucasica TaxID=637954 RepID=A0AAV2JC59_KNICA